MEQQHTIIIENLELKVVGLYNLFSAIDGDFPSFEIQEVYAEDSSVNIVELLSPKVINKITEFVIDRND